LLICHKFPSSLEARFRHDSSHPIALSIMVADGIGLRAMIDCYPFRVGEQWRGSVLPDTL